jgi:hypothetical protein
VNNKADAHPGKGMSARNNLTNTMKTKTAFENLPPVNSRESALKRCPSVRIIYNPELNAMALHHATAKTDGPTIIDLKRLETAAQLLRLIALVENRMPELLSRFVVALDGSIFHTFGFRLHEIGRGRDGLRLDWKRKIVTRR